MTEGEDMQAATAQEEDTQISARVPVPIRRRLAHASIERGIHQRDILIQALQEWLDRNGL